MYRGPILLCVDTSGSMRGARETVAKALALECMRAAKEQERDCYVFAFAGPAEVCGWQHLCSLQAAHQKPVLSSTYFSSDISLDGSTGEACSVGRLNGPVRGHQQLHCSSLSCILPTGAGG